jgi:hypothetical protein
MSKPIQDNSSESDTASDSTVTTPTKQEKNTYITLYQEDRINRDSIVYLQWNGNEKAIKRMKRLIDYINKNSGPYDIDLGDEDYTLEINIDKILTEDEVNTLCKFGPFDCEKCSGKFKFPKQYKDIDYSTLMDKWDVGDIIMDFDTYNIKSHFRKPKHIKDIK